MFELRRGIRFSNGAAVRPEDFRHSLERFLRLDVGAPSSYFDGVLGARACRAEPRSCDLSKGIETDAKARTITIHLRAPDAEFLHELTLPLASVVPADSPMRFARRAASRDRAVPHRELRPKARRAPGAQPSLPVLVAGSAAGRLRRRDRHRRRGEDRRPTRRSTQRRRRHGERVDALFAGTLKPARVRQLAIQYGGQLHSAPEPQLEFMLMNVRVPPFDDARVRRALNYAVDRGEVAELAGGAPIARPTCQLLPPGFPGYRPRCPYTLNPNPAGTWTAPDSRRQHGSSASPGRAGRG